MTCACGNAARYINERGELCCALCPIGEKIDSIKLTDVPKLLAWCRSYLVRGLDVAHHNELRSIIGRIPE